MTVWAKILTSLRDHPKAVEAGPQAMWLYISMILYSKERDTRGYFPASSLSTQCHGRTPSRFAQRLVDVGLVMKVEGGYQVVKFDEKQGKAASLSEKRAADAERKRRQRQRATTGVTRDTSAAVTPLEQSRAEQSRIEVSANALTAREVNDLIPILADLERAWPSLRCRDADRSRRDSAIFDRREDLPPNVVDLARRYVAAHGFADDNLAGCPGLHRWIAEARWLEPLPKSKVAEITPTADDWEREAREVHGSAAA